MDRRKFVCAAYHHPLGGRSSHRRWTAALALLALPACAPVSGSDGDSDGYSIGQGDCDDADAAINPVAAEVCDGQDNNCNGLADEGVSLEAYADTDHDGFGDANGATVAVCEGDEGATLDHSDCDDSDPLVFPGATTSECGSTVDYNCDGIQGEILESGAVLTVAVPSVALTLTVTLDGAAIGSGNTSATDYGTLRFEDLTTGKRFTVWSAWNQAAGAPRGTSSLRMTPGRYAVYYAAGASGAGSAWPPNPDVLLVSTVEVTDGSSLTVDVPVVKVAFTSTLNGQSVSSNNTSAGDEGELRLRSAGSSNSFALYSFWDDAGLVPRGAATMALIPGTYDILYSVVDDGPFWPANVEAVLKIGQVLTADQGLGVNVSTVNVTGTVTLNGQTVSANNTDADDEGSLLLEDASGNRFEVMTTYDDSAGQATGSRTFQVIPGVYSVLYSVQDGGSHWPYNEEVLLKSGVSMTGQTSFSVDVPTITLQVTPTLGGQTLSASNGSALDEGELSLEDTSTGKRFKLFSTWRDGSDQPIQVPVAVPLIPGTFDMLYGVQDDGPFWPANTRRLLKAGLTLSSSQALSVDIPVVTATVTLTLDGQTSSSANTSIEDEGLIELEEVSSGDRFKLFTSWNDTTDQSAVPFSGRILPGTYHVYYSVSDDGPHWPSNTSVLLQSAVDFTLSKSLTLDIPVSELTLVPTLAESAVSSGNTSAGAWGTFSLRDVLTDESFPVFSPYNALTGQVAASSKVQVLPGAYTVEYSSEQVGSAWPGGEDVPVGCFTLH